MSDVRAERCDDCGRMARLHATRSWVSGRTWRVCVTCCRSYPIEMLCPIHRPKGDNLEPGDLDRMSGPG